MRKTKRVPAAAGAVALLTAAVLLATGILPLSPPPVAAETTDGAAAPYPSRQLIELGEDDKVKAESMPSFETPEEKLETMTELANNGTLALYGLERTGEIAVKDLRSEEVVFSNPIDVGMQENVSPDEMNLLYSQIVLEYYSQRAAAGTAYSFRDAAGQNYKQIFFETTGVENGVAVRMTLGRLDQQMLVPLVMPFERMEFILAFYQERIDGNAGETDEDAAQLKADKRALTRIGAFYTKQIKDELTETKRKQLIEEYPSLEFHDLYTRRRIMAGKEQAELEGYLVAAGYTRAMMEEDNAFLNVSADESNFPLFDITIIYRLEGGEFVVEIPADQIQFDETSYILNKIHVLPYFGTKSRSEGGYMFVPDGSGALIEFNDSIVRWRQNKLTGMVYGEDISIDLSLFNGKRKQYSMPVYGIASGESALFSVIEKGDALAEITASTDRAMNPYNAVYSIFTYQTIDKYQDSVSDASTTRFDQTRYKGAYNQRYFFLDGDNANYAGMANVYRQYLIDMGVLKKNGKTSPSLLVELLGSTRVDDKFLIFDAERKAPLTTFSQAQEIIRDIKDNGIDNLRIRYQGWANGGLEHTVFNKAIPQSELGGSKGLKSLVEFAAECGVPVYPEVNFLYFYRDGVFDGYSPTNNSAFRLDNRLSGITPVHTVTSRLDRSRFMYSIAPTQIPGYAGKFLKSYGKLDIGALSAASLGNTLYSDFKSNRRVTTDKSKQIVEELLDTLSGSYRMMSDTGNAYIYPYVDYIANLPTTSSEFLMENESVPFMQMVLHSYIEYGSSTMNLESDLDVALLKAIETGSGLNFIMGRENLEKLKNSAYSLYVSVGYDDWKDTCFSQYKTLSEVFEGLVDKDIVGHRSLANQVYETTYEGGTKILVNYNKTPVTAEGQEIPALGYKIVR